MAHAGAWPSIRNRGLLSTTALLDMLQVNDEKRHRIERQHRSEPLTILQGTHEPIVFRDQKAMSEGALLKSLDGITPEEWYLTLNGLVFFWVSMKRVQKLLDARAYRDHVHTVITVDTATLVKAYAPTMLLSPINSGSTIYNPVRRGKGTFLPFESYPFEERRKLRGTSNAVAEAAIRDEVPDLRDHALRVEHRKGTFVCEVVYTRV